MGSKESCISQNITLLASVGGYAKDTKRSIAFFQALFKHKAYTSTQQFLFMHDDIGKMPKEIKDMLPSDFNLDVVPHPKVMLPDTPQTWLRQFAQLKFISQLLESGKRMKCNPNLKYYIMMDNDVTINFLEIENVLNKYMPFYKNAIGGTIVYNYLDTGYIGGGVIFMTRKAVLTVCAYILNIGHFPGSLLPGINKLNPMANVDVYIAAIVQNLGGEIIHLPGAYTRSSYCGYPLEYVTPPIIASQHSYGEDKPTLPQHDEVLEFMLNFEG
eukprot:g1858.t1